MVTILVVAVGGGGGGVVVSTIHSTEAFFKVNVGGAIVEVLETIMNMSYHVFVAYTRNYNFRKILVDGLTIDENGVLAYLSSMKPFTCNLPVKYFVLILISMIL